jgi:hypothetical protein
MVILKNLGVDRLSCAYFVRSEPPQGSRIFLEPGIVVSGRRRGRRVRLRAARWARPRAKPLRLAGRGACGEGRCARSLPGIVASGRRRGRRVRPRAAPLRRAGRGRCARSLPGIVASGRRRGRRVRPCAKLAGSSFVPLAGPGPVCPIAPRHRGLWAAPRSPGQAPCPARRVRHCAKLAGSGFVPLAGPGPVLRPLGQAPCRAP